MSLREKSAWISLGITLFVYVPYFAGMLGPLFHHEFTLAAVLPLFLGAVLLQTMLMVASQIVLALIGRGELADERDRIIDARAHRVGYNVLHITASFTLLCLIALTAIPAEIRIGQAPAVAFLGQVLLLCLVLAELARNATEIVCYRRGS